MIIISMFLLVMIPLYENNFYKEPILSEWKQLTWDDFQGTHPPFTGWAAAIYSDIYLDSSGTETFAKSLQNNQRSFKTDNLGDGVYTLQHEQTHFNITEAFTRKFNADLKDTSRQPMPLQLAFKLAKANKNRWQYDYDRETDHGLIESQQYRWELKVDSMLWAYGEPKVEIIDYFRGASIEFPAQPTFELSDTSEGGSSIRHYYIDRYNISFILSVYQSTASNIETYEVYYNNRIKEDGLKAFEFHVNREKGALDFVFYDSTDNTMNFEYLELANPGAVGILASFISDRPDSLAAIRVSKAFRDSYNRVNTDEYWVSLAKTYKGFESVQVNKKTNSQDLVTLDGCYTPSYLESAGMTGPVTKMDNDTLVMAYHPMDTEVGLIDEFLWNIDDKLIAAESREGIAIFKVHKSDIPSGFNSTRIGFTLNTDFADGCNTFYYEPYSLNIDFQ